MTSSSCCLSSCGRKAGCARGSHRARRVGYSWRAAYHLGNRHVAVEIGEQWLRFAADEVLAQMLRGLDATVIALSAPFEPEAGAYGGGHHHHSMEATHSGIIHEFRDFKQR